MNSDFLLPNLVLFLPLAIVFFFLLKYWPYWILPENNRIFSDSFKLVRYGFYCKLSLWLQDVSTLSSVGNFGHDNYFIPVSMATRRKSLGKQTDGFRRTLALPSRLEVRSVLQTAICFQILVYAHRSLTHMSASLSPLFLSPLLFSVSVCVCMCVLSITDGNTDSKGLLLAMASLLSFFFLSFYCIMLC